MEENIEWIGMSRRQFLATALAGSAMLASSVMGFSAFAAEAPPFELPTLPYPETALDPYISARTLGFHYGKHHRAYVDKINELVKGTDLAGLSLREIIRKTAGDEKKSGIFKKPMSSLCCFWICS